MNYKINKPFHLLEKNIIESKIIEDISALMIDFFNTSIFPDMIAKNIIDKDKKILIDNDFNLNIEEKKLLTGHYPLKFRIEIYKKIINSKKLFEFLENKIFKTDDFYLYLPPMCRFSLPQNKYSLTPWHVDKHYNHYLEEAYTVWMPLVNIDNEIGGIGFYEGKYDDSYHKNNENKIFFSSIDLPNESKIIKYNMKKTDILIFNNNTIHKSISNKSDKIRYSLDIRFTKKEPVSSHRYYYKQKKKLEPNENK